MKRLTDEELERLLIDTESDAVEGDGTSFVKPITEEWREYQNIPFDISPQYPFRHFTASTGTNY